MRDGHLTAARNVASVAVLASPSDFAEHYSPTPWQTTRHQRVIGDAIADAVFAGVMSILIVECPPQHGKSAIVSQWTPAWYLSLYPRKNVAVVSYESTIASRWGRWVRDTLREIGTVEIADDATARDNWSTSQGGVMLSVGVGGPLTSRSIDLLVIDDPIKNSEEADSETIREKVWDWFQTTAWTRKQPGTVFVLMHTRWHEDDLVGRVLAHPEMSKYVKRMRMPALAEADDVLGRLPGEALWPSRFPADASPDGLLTTKAVLTPRWWSALYQQRPSAQEGAEIKRSWWRFYDELPVRRDQLDIVITSWDCAFRDSSGSDYVVGQAWGVYGSYRYLLDQVHERLDFVGTCKAVLLMSEKWNPNATLIEAKANGDAVINVLRASISGVVPVEPQGGKEARVRAAAPQIEAGNVILPKTSWASELVEEAAAFPLGKHDDMVDACSQALNWLLHHNVAHVSELPATDDRFIPPHIAALRQRGVMAFGTNLKLKGRI